MKSRTSSFNRTLFLRTAARFWPIWCGYGLVWLAALPLRLGSSLAACLRTDNLVSLAQALRSDPMRLGTDAGVVVSLIFCCMAAMGVYGYLYFPRSSGAYGALPLRREGVFFSVTLAGLGPLLGVNVLIFLITLLTEAACGASDLPALLVWLGSVSLECVFFFGFAAFCAQLTGNLIVLPVVYFLLNFAVYVVEYAVQRVLSLFVFGYPYAGSPHLLTFLSPAMRIAERCNVVSDFTVSEIGVYTFSGWGTLLAYAAAGLAFLAGALLLYRARRLETAGDVVSVRVLRPVFRYCLALGCALCLGLLLYNTIFGSSYAGPYAAFGGNPAALLGLMLAGCFIGWFAAEMLLRKSFSVFRSGRIWLGFGICCAVLALFIASSALDLWGYETRVPDPGTVASVTVTAGGDQVTLKDADNIADVTAVHRGIVQNKRIHESNTGASCSVGLTYTLKNGGTMVRSYLIVCGADGENADARALQTVINSGEAIRSRKQTAFPVTPDNIVYATVSYAVPGEDGQFQFPVKTLSAEELYELYTQCILPDIADGTLGRIWLIQDDAYSRTVCDASIYFECTGPGRGGSYQSFYTVPTVDSARTNAWLSAHGVTLLTVGETGSTTNASAAAAVCRAG